MMWPPLGRRAARLAARLEGRQVTGSLDDDTAALVSLAERLRRVESPVMSAAYASDLRVRLMDAAPTLLDAADGADLGLPRPARRRRGTRQLRLGIATATAIVLATAVGIGFASQKALPGDPLYPFKQTIEHVQVATAGSLLAKGDAQLGQATTRLSEVQDLAQSGSSDPVTSTLMADTLGDFSDQASDGTATLLSAYRENGEPRAIVDLRHFTTQSVASLTTLSTQVPPGVLPDVGEVATQMTSDDAQAVAACSDCTDTAPLALPARLLAIVPATPPDGIPAPSESPSTSPPASPDASVSADPSTAGSAPSSVPDLILPPPPPAASSSVTDPAIGVPPPESAGGSTVSSEPPPVTSGDPTTQPVPSDSAGPTLATSPDPPSSGSEPPESTGPASSPSLASDQSGLTSAPESGSEGSIAPRD